MPMKGGQLKNILPYKIMILNNATTLMHKSTLSTNIFGNDHFGQKYQKQKKLKILGYYKGVWLKNFQRIEQKLENAFFGQIFHSFENFVTLKN